MMCDVMVLFVKIVPSQMFDSPLKTYLTFRKNLLQKYQHIYGIFGTLLYMYYRG